MELNNLNKWLSLIANLGVLVGVFFLAFEIQQNTLYLRQGESNITFDQVSLNRMMGMDEGMAELVVRATEDYSSLSQADLFRYTEYVNQWMWTSHNIYQRELNGYLEEGEWQRSGKAIILGYINNPGGRASWRQFAPMFPEEFRALVEETLRE